MPVTSELLWVAPRCPMLLLDVSRGLGYERIGFFTPLVSHRRAYVAIDNGVVVDGDIEAEREFVRHLRLLIVFCLVADLTV